MRSLRTGARPGEKSAAHRAALALLFVTMATSGFVFSEPCPTDLLMVGLIVLLPVMGLTHFNAPLASLLLIFAGAAACGLIATTAADDTSKALTHTLVSLYLYGATIVIAGFVALDPERRSTLVLNGSLVAALLAASAGLLGYFGAVPNAEMFTKFGRAAGTFKDPNVFGPFLVPSLLYALHIAIGRSLKKVLMPLAAVAVLAAGVLLSFSRGAWINLIVALGIYLILAFVTAGSATRRKKIVLLAVLGAGAIAGLIGGALQIEQVRSLLGERASLAQSYDVGPEGRFGGQEKAVALILENPLGIGAQEFSPGRHHEEVHNVYLSMPLNAGWLGAGLYAVAVGLTIVVGFGAAFRSDRAQPFLIIALAAFTANAAEGIVIDTDHWRHFYLLMALVWGIATSPILVASAPDASRKRARRRGPQLLMARAPKPRSRSIVEHTGGS